MKNWMKRGLVGLLLLGLVVSVPALTGCNSKKDNENKAGFKEENLDPTKVKMEPLTGPGGSPLRPKTLVAGPAPNDPRTVTCRPKVPRLVAVGERRISRQIAAGGQSMPASEAGCR